MQSSTLFSTSKSHLHGSSRLSQSLNDFLNPGKTRPSLRLRVQKDPTFKYTFLKITGRELTELPRELFELSDLEYLILSPERESGLTLRLLEVPRSIGRLDQLKILCLDTNELRKIPAEIGTLVNLERLVLSNNLLTSLPSSLSDLQRLKHLHIANNYFKAIPSCVYSMLNLEFLDASDNKIMEISEDISALVALEALLLFFNLLETVPDSITKCVNLTNLWLGRNRLRSLPENFGDLTKLDWEFHPNPANIAGNPNLLNPPLEICLQGPDAIRDYFKDGEVEPEKRDTYNCYPSGESGNGRGDSSASSLHMSVSEWSDVLDNSPRKK